MDLPERYKMRAQLYLERARQAANPGARQRLLKMAEYWLLRAELAYEETRKTTDKNRLN